MSSPPSNPRKLPSGPGPLRTSNGDSMATKRFKFEAAIESSDDGRLSIEAKRAIVFYELDRRGELPHSSFRPVVSRNFAVLSDNTAIWLKNQQARGYSDWVWFASALKFLDGYGVMGSDFERIKETFLAHFRSELERFNEAQAQKVERQRRSEAERLLDDQRAANERKKLIGGLGGIHSDSPPTSGYWDKIDAGHWREQE